MVEVRDRLFSILIQSKIILKLIELELQNEKQWEMRVKG